MWTDTTIETLKRLWAEGKTATETGFLMGITRNAVIGKISRLGMCGRKIASSINRPPKKQANPRQPKTRFPLVVATEAVELPVEVTVSNPIHLIELSGRTCRWPVEVEDEPLMYCGTLTTEDCVYCVPHSRMAYRDMTVRIPVTHWRGKI